MRVRRWFIAVLVLLSLLLLAKHLLLDNAAAAHESFVIDIDALHRAATTDGPLPQSIEVEKVGEFAFPRTLVVAGDGFRMHPMVLLAHRVVWPDKSVVIDTAMSPSATSKMPRGRADPAAFERVRQAIRQASAIVFTHEHVDHVGGAAATPDPLAIVDRVKMTREQQTSPKFEREDFPPGLLDKLVPLDYQGLYTVAPGVVLQKAPGHSPGSQLIYVELANGSRFLFVGDIAWTNDNIRLQIGRPGIATLLMQENRQAVAAQVQALAHVPSNVHIVVAHDPVALQRDLDQGLYRMGFSNLGDGK